MTPDPNTFAKASRYKWELYGDTKCWCIHYFQVYIDTFAKLWGSGADLTLLKHCSRDIYMTNPQNVFSVQWFYTELQGISVRNFSAHAPAQHFMIEKSVL